MDFLLRKLADEDFIKCLRCHDIILLSETWISNKHLVNLDIDDYENFHLFGHKSIKTKKGAKVEVYQYILEKK